MNAVAIELSIVFVDLFPKYLEERTLYISTKYQTASHLCPCGCQEEIVTPLSPDDWQMTYDGRTVSMQPSIGNWGLACRSHYWIRHNIVDWAEAWTDRQVLIARNISSPKKHSGISRVMSPYERSAPVQREMSRTMSLWSKIVSLFSMRG